MYNKLSILSWIVVFIAIATLPFYYNTVKASSKLEVSLDTPVISKMSKKQCVLPAAEMREKHMQLLDNWRDETVRDGKSELGVIDGVQYEKSLQKTCLKCHSNKQDFCDKCHEYVNVKPYCFNCHIAPEEK